MASSVESETKLRYGIEPNAEENRRACAVITRAMLPPSRWDLAMFFILVGVAVAAFYLTPETMATTVAIGFVAAVGTAVALQLEMRLRVRRLRLNDPHAQETHYIELSPEGIRTWCAHVEMRYPWRDYAKVFENEEFFVFARATGTGSVVPKRLLGPTREAELRQYLRVWNAPGAGQ